MKTYPLATLAVASFISMGAPSVIAAPQIIQASDPVRPDETVLVTGEGFSNDSKAELAVMPDRPGAEPQKWEEITPLQCENQSLKFVIPKTWKHLSSFATKMPENPGETMFAISSFYV